MLYMADMDALDRANQYMRDRGRSVELTTEARLVRIERALELLTQLVVAKEKGDA